MKHTLLILCFLLLSGFLSVNAQEANTGLTALPEKFNHPSLGENVFLFDPGMDMNEIQVVIDTLFARQSARRSEFTTNRYALLFKPGEYDLDIRVGYYMQIAGLGESPEDVVIKGAVRSNSRGKSVLVNFWRAVENLTIIPTTDSTVTWGVSQAAPMRRVYIKGNMNLFDKGYASGGFLADSKVEGTVASGPQQQWFTRNSQMGKWVGGNWNMMFVGVPDAPEEDWTENPYTTIDETPIVREKPFLAITDKGIVVKIPVLKMNSSGPGWVNHVNDENTLNLNKFYIVKSGVDNSESINSALKKGKNLLFTPGIYSIDKALKVTRKNTIIMGLGMPSLVPLNGNPVIEISDVDGVTVSGILLDAGIKKSEVLLQVGKPGSAKNHEANPSFLFDVFVRVGGPHEGSVTSAVVINSNNVIVDHIWLWRADHVKTHEAWGIGIYNVFYQAPVIVDNAIETPPELEDSIHHKIIFWLNGNKDSEVRSIINGKGGPVNQSVRKATMK